VRPVRIDPRPLVVATGAVLLAISLFIDWFEPDLTAWNAFELVDVLLATIALAAILVAATLYSPTREVDTRVLPALGAAALVLVASQLIDAPPTAGVGGHELGAWLGLVGATLLFAGALLSVARISLALTFERRVDRGSRRGTPLRGPAPPAAEPPAPDTRVPPDRAPTKPLESD